LGSLLKPLLRFLSHFNSHLLHGNFNAPVEDDLESGITVLYAGYGSGRWCLEMAADFPNSNFIDVNISGVFPTIDIPHNLAFVKANTLTGLPFDDCTFDYAFQRFVGYSFSPSDWEVSVKELARVTKPGGWVELFELISKLNRPPPDHDILSNVVKEMLLARGVDMGVKCDLPKLLTAQGFEDISSDFVSAPINWNGQVGVFMKNNLMNFWEACRPVVMSKLGLDEEGCTDLYIRTIQQMAKAKTYIDIPYVYGRKPFV
ncbi:S-adenosyl-L-methionine-dependent methyltransferase, partial [Jimgerdemannia flammicorona]